MKAILLTAVFLLMLAATARADILTGYKLVWDDEFKGPALDLGKWKPDTYKRDAAQLSAKAFDIGADGLRIRTWTENGINYTGFMTSHGLFMPTYGYFESRIRFRGAPGQHCAFWLQPEQLGKIIGDPGQSGVETDIVEHRLVDKDGKDISNMAAFNLHWDGYKANHKTTGSKWLAPASLNGTWHTYGVLWTPVGYVFYVDNTERWRSSAAVSHAPQDVRLTCEIKGPSPTGQASWSGKIPAGGYGSRETTPYGMDVNWIRAWQKVD
jgi:beta-glucanase (GH16 family)